MSLLFNWNDHPGANWLGLRWSTWMPLVAAHPLALAQLPSHPGLLRVRRAGSADELEWAGWVQHGVRETAERLSRQVHLPVPPYDDPLAPARVLWEAKRRDGASFEVSGVVPPESLCMAERWAEPFHLWCAVEPDLAT